MMKSSSLKLASIVCGVFSNILPAFSGEFLVKDEIYTITDRPIIERVWYTVPGPPDWTIPDDYYNGQFYIRYEIISQPTSRQCMLQFVMWQDFYNGNPVWLEQAGSQVTMSGPGDVKFVNSSPATWWKYQGNSLDFTRPGDITKLGIVVWSKSPVVRIASYLTSPDEIQAYADRFDWVPLKIRYTIVAVSAGSTFSGNWNAYMSGAGLPKGSSKSIEAENMTLSSYTIETNTNASMNSQIKLTAASGNASVSFPHTTGNYDISVDYLDEYDGASAFSLLLNNIQIGNWIADDVATGNYFRKYTLENVNIHNGDELKIQCIRDNGENGVLDYIDFVYNGGLSYDIPAFSIDYANETTAQVVSTNFQYSCTQTSWTTGANQKVELTPGNNIYFRPSDSPTSIQTLIVPTRSAAPAFSIDFVHETTTGEVSAAYSWSNSPDMSGSVAGNSTLFTLIPGIDLYFWQNPTGSAFRSQVQALLVPERPATPSIGIDFMNEQTNMTIGGETEYSVFPGMTDAVLGPGSPVSIVPGTDLYFRTRASGTAFRSPVQHLIVPARSLDLALSIDYGIETSNEAMSPDYEYSLYSDMADAQSGSGTTLLLDPGVNVYYRKKASVSSFVSGIQQLPVPGRPDAMNLSIDFVSRQTNELLSNEYEFSVHPDLSELQWGNNSKIDLTPGIYVYYRKKATDAAFRSDPATLNVPEQPVVPPLTIDYLNETTVETIADTVQYDFHPEMITIHYGTNSPLALLADTVYYFRISAGDYSFASDNISLVTPSRTEAPLFGIDFIVEKTAEPVPLNVLFSAQEDFVQYQQGNDELLDLTPGENIYFRRKGNESLFGSEKVLLDIPERPYFTLNGGGNSTHSNPIEFILHSEIEIGEHSLENIQVSNGSVISVLLNTVISVKPDTIGTIVISLPADTSDQGHFASETFEVDYRGVVSTLDILSETSLEIFPNPSSGILSIELPSGLYGRYFLQVHDSRGRKIMELVFTGHTFDLDLRALPSGLYLLGIADELGNKVNQKIIMSR